MELQIWSNKWPLWAQKDPRKTLQKMKEWHPHCVSRSFVLTTRLESFFEIQLNVRRACSLLMQFYSNFQRGWNGLNFVKEFVFASRSTIKSREQRDANQKFL